MKKGKKRKHKNNMKNTEQKGIRGRKDNEEKVEKEKRINIGTRGRGGTRGKTKGKRRKNMEKKRKTEK